jgi:glycosyltransferase involved in cell wall biosynthesis
MLKAKIKQRWFPEGSQQRRLWDRLSSNYARFRLLRWRTIRPFLRIYRYDGLSGIFRYGWLKIRGMRDLVYSWWYTFTQDSSFLEDFDNFINQQNAKSSPGVVIIYAGVPYSEVKPLRSVWVTRELLRRGYQVLFVYWRWRPTESYPQKEEQAGLYQMPMDVFWVNAGEILRVAGQRQGQKLFLIDFPHPSLFKVVNIANGHGWVTVLTQKDDWEAFQKVGQASWYDEEIERYLLENSDVLVGTAKALVEKMRGKVEREVHLVPNAYEPESLSLGQEGKGMRRGEVTLGYFGHLTGAWFDWEIVKGLAERHPGWEVYLIGSGGEGEGLPGNVHLLGRQEHDSLAGYARGWDVGLIPFKEGELSRGVDPLKVYEYLAMGLPVVASGMPQLGGIPGVQVVRGVEGYEAAIEAVLGGRGIDQGEVEAYLAEQTWEKRVNKILVLAGFNNNGS